MQTQQDPSKHTLRAVLQRRRPLIFILIVLCLLFVASYTTRMGTLRRLQVEQVTLMERKEQAQINALRLNQDLEDVTSDAHVEKVAVEELGMTRDDETVVMLVDAPEVAAPAAESEAVDASMTAPAPTAPSVWRQWVELFAGQRE